MLPQLASPRQIIISVFGQAIWLGCRTRIHPPRSENPASVDVCAEKGRDLRPALSATFQLRTASDLWRSADDTTQVVRERGAERGEERHAVDRDGVVLERFRREADDRQAEVRNGVA